MKRETKYEVQVNGMPDFRQIPPEIFVAFVEAMEQIIFNYAAEQERSEQNELADTTNLI